MRYLAILYLGSIALTQPAPSQNLRAKVESLDPAPAPMSIWPTIATPGNGLMADPRSVTVGMKFRSDVPGYVLGVRFYRSGLGNDTGLLYGPDGSKLAEANFVETTPGWQQTLFSQAVPIAANTTYVVAYITNAGYALDQNFFTSRGVDNPPLHALKSGADGANGVYHYDNHPDFPTETYANSNYWVDVVFSLTAPPSVVSTPPTPPITTAPGPLGILAGPVIPIGTAPWPFFDSAETGNFNDITATALAHLPTPGPAASATFTLNDGCPVTLTGPAAKEFAGEHWAVVYWDAPSGLKTGRWFVPLDHISGNTITYAALCGLAEAPGLVAQSGLEVHHCTDACGQATPPASGRYYDFGIWGPLPLDGWNFYDVAKALYDHAQRTGDPADMAKFEQWADTWWVWGLNQGAIYPNYPRDVGLLGQIIRILEGNKPERWAPLARMVMTGASDACLADPNNCHLDTTSPYVDWRETGYGSMWAAMLAIADPDPARHLTYCTITNNYALDAIAAQKPEGYWSTKRANFPYRPPGASPWGLFSLERFLTYAYDVLNDTSAQGCNQPASAAPILPALQKAGDFNGRYNHAPNRGGYYDVIYPNVGLAASAGTGTVSAKLHSATVTGTGTQFKKDFAQLPLYITIPDSAGVAWTYKVISVQSDTALTIETPYADGGDGMGPTADTANVHFQITPPAPTKCNGVAPTCWTGNAGPDGAVLGDRVDLFDDIYLFGWLYKTTGDPKWIAYGDEHFSAAYGGPSAGPGFNWPGYAGACGGPGCDNTIVQQFIGDIHGCSQSINLPCNPIDQWGGAQESNLLFNNAAAYAGKYYGQCCGIGSAANYLAWRLLPSQDQ